MTLSPEIFRAYDIRGIADKTITEEVAYAIGRAFAVSLHELQQTQACVGRDVRLTGEKLENALIKGLLDSGISVIRLGVIATPLLYFATHQLNCPNGVMVTASHNPAEYNGFKFVLNQCALDPAHIQTLKQRIIAQQFIQASPTATVTEYNIIPDYIDYVAKQVHLSRPLKIIVDAGNAAAGHIAPELYRRLGCEVIELYCDLDGRFPNHHPDPGHAANVKDLQQAVLEHQADIGLAFDGDADRIGVITNKASMIAPDRLMMLLAQAVLKEAPGRPILFDVKCTNHLPRVIDAAGGQAVMWKTGHSFIKLKVKEIQAALAGEMSGHIFFNDRWFGFDDGIYTGARLLEVLSKAQGTSDELFAVFPETCSTPEINLTVQEAEKFSFIEKVIAGAVQVNAEKNLLDGLRLEYHDGWALVRASNTSPVVVLRFEADSPEALARIQLEVKAILLAVKSDLHIPF
ncbi:MAG: Phosphomannomutase [Gammaproteobacteria bacterium]|jgi:phosphomannomutase|nr:Phosphomannomutase [Gammaproteobacteria bacterium]